MLWSNISRKCIANFNWVRFRIMENAWHHSNIEKNIKLKLMFVLALDIWSVSHEKTIKTGLKFWFVLHFPSAKRDESYIFILLTLPGNLLTTESVTYSSLHQKWAQFCHFPDHWSDCCESDAFRCIIGSFSSKVLCID